MFGWREKYQLEVGAGQLWAAAEFKSSGAHYIKTLIFLQSSVVVTGIWCGGGTQIHIKVRLDSVIAV